MISIARTTTRNVKRWREEGDMRRRWCAAGLLEAETKPRFSFLGEDVIHGEQALRELGDWGWGSRLANAGVQRLEFEGGCQLPGKCSSGRSCG